MVDTNVVLDDILNRAPNADIARRISRLVTDGIVNGHITANCLTDIFYIVSKYRNDGTARKVIRNLLLAFSVVGVDDGDCRAAIDLPVRGFEDALVVIRAEKADLSYIVTNDKGFQGIADSSVSVISPSDFLLKFVCENC
ncbi:MAG: PIN domain-containing protein [Clostridiales Family XIII bacterium]|jgi:predicted nucleic acid-binding protein|nr:PIN domain-containing protein [Clostridiales Family XIII bacterium]